MHIPTHLFSGWCVGNLLPLTPRERLLCTLTAVLPDWDGITLLHSQWAYRHYHHVWGHNVFFGMALAAGFAAYSRRGSWRFLGFWLLYLFIFHMHLAMDFVGSGYGWTISYFWPISPAEFSVSWAWGFMAWQNYAVMLVVLLGTAWIYRYKKRGPLECISPRIDNAFVEIFSWGRRKESGKQEEPT